MVSSIDVLEHANGTEWVSVSGTKHSCVQYVSGGGSPSLVPRLAQEGPQERIAGQEYAYL